jgi:hypothetical protein
MYCEDENQKDWSLHLKAVCFAINVSFDVERGDTPFYLMHGWDAKTTMEAMFPTPDEIADNVDAKLWRESANKVYRQVTALVKTHYREKQIERAMKTWNKIRGKQYEVGDRVWLYATGVKLENKKLAHSWIGPYRIKEAHPDQPHYYVLDIQGNNEVSPAVHFDRLKPCVDHSDRPTEKLLETDLPPIEFDENLMPVDSFEDEYGYFGVTKLLDRRWYRKSKRAKPVLEYLVKWEDGGESWVRDLDLNCPSLVEDYEKEFGKILPLARGESACALVEI